MNNLIEEEFPLYETQKLRYDLMDTLTDSDLMYKLPGDNLTLGELCREIGEVEHAYIQSFRTLQHDLSYRATQPELSSRVDALKTWYKTLDSEFEAVLHTFSDDDLHNKQIERGDGFKPSAYVQFQIYREALLMFYAKASIYLKGLQKTVSDQWQAWVG